MHPVRCVLFLLLLMPLPATAQTSVRERLRAVEREILRAQDRTADFYMNAHPNTFLVWSQRRSRSGAYYIYGSSGPPPPDCIALEHDGCLWSDRECLTCMWDATAAWELAAFYDEAATKMGRAPAGVRVDMLDWLAGQRIGVWTRLREYDRARAAAAECQASLWWCEALRAHVEHRAGDHVAAEELYRRALQLMTPGRACFWNELHVYHDTLTAQRGARASIGFDGSFRYRAEPRVGASRPCPDTRRTAAFWVLADPLFSRAGNDRLTEHYTRLVELHIHALFRSIMTRFPDGEGRFHSAAHHSAVVRWGWPVGRSRALTTVRASSSSTAAVYDPRGQSFLVTKPIANALSAPADLFNLGTNRPIEVYRPPYGPIEPLPLQTGFFRRQGESVLLVRAQLPPADPPAAAHWQLRSWDGTTWRDADVLRLGRTLTSWLTTPWLPQVVSVEGMHSRGAYRARTGNRPPEAATESTAVSSLIVVDATMEHTTLETAALAMLPRTTLTARDSVAGFFELYTMQPRSAQIELAIKPIHDGFLSRLGIGRQPDRSLRWTEHMEPVRGVVARTVALDLTALPAGDYDVVLTLTLDTSDVVSTVTRVVIGEH